MGGAILPTSDFNSADDELLAVRCQMGEPGAFNDLIDRWSGPLWSFVRRLVDNDDQAREAIQDLWLRVIRGIPHLRDGSKLRPWLFGIARRALMDRLREQYARAPAVDTDVDDLPAEQPLYGADELAALAVAMGRLPILEREAVTLFYLQELSLGEIAETLMVPVGTVKSRLFRGRRLLRQHLTERG